MLRDSRLSEKGDQRLRIQKKRFCETCLIMRPALGSHCANCDHCVKGFDHHCVYINNCVGVRNSWNFAALSNLSVLAMICYMILLYNYLDNLGITHNLSDKDIGSIKRNYFITFAYCYVVWRFLEEPLIFLISFLPWALLSAVQFNRKVYDCSFSLGCYPLLL